ncbi:hypothetical protein BDR06DRAFT_972981 [Suillus hirtellus]|nr:hypothetical protein BDR06DRAFT_972981 [Suillus hirtellus]
MTVPPEQANQALNITLATLQSLMKHCIKVKEGDPEALRLSDEIVRRMAKDLKMYGRSATSFLPQLLSFAAVVRENSKGSAFKSVPDWTSVTDNNPRIKSHPHFDKTVDYISPSLDDLSTDPATANPPTTLTTPTTITLPSASTSMPSLMESNVLVEPEVETNRSSGLRKGEAEDHPIPIDTPTSPLAKYNLFVPGTKKRKPATEDMDEAVVVPTNKSPSPSEEPVKKKKKVESQPIARPAVWGSDADIATPWKHSVHYHPQQCDKCVKLDIACVILLDKKFGFMCLTCENCNSMKILCVIDGVGVHQRLQAKAAKASADPSQQPKPLKSWAISKKPMTCVSCSQWSITKRKDFAEKKLDVLLGWAQMQPEHVQPPTPSNLLDPEPTAREILQGIQDLGRRLDLLTANEQVDTLEVRVGSVETNVLKQLDELEQQLNASDARWRSLETLG